MNTDKNEQIYLLNKVNTKEMCPYYPENYQFKNTRTGKFKKLGIKISPRCQDQSSIESRRKGRSIIIIIIQLPTNHNSVHNTKKNQY